MRGAVQRRRPPKHPLERRRSGAEFSDRTSQGRATLPQDQPPPRQLARRLIESRRSERAVTDSAARAAAAACDHLYRDLSRWVGPDGCHALFTRARAQAQADHPALDQIHPIAGSEFYLHGVAETIMAHGDAATGKALESMLISLIELLGRLIGDDMATKLIGRALHASDRRDATFDGTREEA